MWNFYDEFFLSFFILDFTILIHNPSMGMGSQLESQIFCPTTDSKITRYTRDHTHSPPQPVLRRRVLKQRSVSKDGSVKRRNQEGTAYCNLQEVISEAVVGKHGITARSARNSLMPCIQASKIDEFLADRAVFRTSSLASQRWFRADC